MSEGFEIKMSEQVRKGQERGCSGASEPIKLHHFGSGLLFRE